MDDSATQDSGGAGEAGGSVCAVCGRRFRCGAEAGEDDCWCWHRPPVALPPELPAGRCLCPDCLDRVAREALDPTV